MKRWVCVVPKSAKCPVCRELVHYNKFTGQFMRHRNPTDKARLCAGSQLATPVKNTVKAKAKQREKPRKVIRKDAVAAPVEPDPRQRCSYCFKLLMPRADGCFRVHTVASGVRCEGSGRPAVNTVIRSTSRRNKAAPDDRLEKDFLDLSIKDLREVASVAAELEAEQLAEARIVRRMELEIEDKQQLKAYVRRLSGSQEPPEEIQTRLGAEANKWRRRGIFWRNRVCDLEERYELDPDSWAAELDAARDAMKRCAQSCKYIEKKILELRPQTAAAVDSGSTRTPQGARPPEKTINNMSAAERIWSAVQRLWR